MLPVKQAEAVWNAVSTTVRTSCVALADLALSTLTVVHTAG